MTASAEARAYQFGPFRLDLDRRVLLRGDEQLTLSPKSFETLLILVEEAGAPVAKDTLLARVWSDVAVEENSVAKAVSEIRRALGDSPRVPQFIATLSGHGYRFAAAVERIGRSMQPRRIAVLPFTHLSPADADEYLAVGLADSLITRLSGLHEIAVRPTRAILPFASGNHDPVAAGRQLDVDSVLDGTVRMEGDRVRVTAQLVEVSTAAITWADTFYHPFSGFVSLEEVISNRLVVALALVITGKERQFLTRRHTIKPEAYECDLRGRFHLARRTADDCRLAIASFERALDADPEDALAYSGIAEAYIVLGIQALVMGGLAPSQAFPRAKVAIEQALRLDPHMADLHISRGQVTLLYDWQSQAAERSHQNALALNPHSAWGHHAYAMMLSFTAQHETALALMQRARELDPLSPIINTNLGRVLYNARRYDHAIEQLQWTVRYAPDVVVAHYRLGLAFEAVHRVEEAIDEFKVAQHLSGTAPAVIASLAYTYAIAGRRDDAHDLLDSLFARAAKEYVAAPCIAEVLLALGRRNDTFDWLDRAIDERSSMLVMLQANHRYDTLREDRRFRSLVDRVGLWR